jgi:DNA-binding NarL/FixJ family response regulator
VSFIRVLVVDDFARFRGFVSSMLGTHPDFQVVGEASDELEAVQKAEKLQPDLIVLDLGLPSLNGLEAARRIRRLSSKSKIIVASQESSAEVVKEALRSGALAYVAKACLFTDLIPAIHEAMLGHTFVSGSLPV